ncbi:hypothetical protein GGX14DRAFT_571049 [Mycena pura]|uniref:Zn(2)-C6 fungal-type domain-containing protein n=1 Tax=Mycena pura TaxID=153505 RepID=A0AAD6V440_9AGAR|nr:hypothetical protein GGX14DRAFT_571049 [Mycena pura]
MPLSRRATPHPDAPHEPLFLADPDDDSNYSYPMLMSPSQAPAHITRDIGDDDDAPRTLQASVLPGPSTPSLRPASLQHLLVGSPQTPQAPSLPGPAQAPQGLRLPSIDSLPLSSGSLVLPPLTPRNVHWSSPLVTPPQQLAPRSPPRRVPSFATMALTDPRTGLLFMRDATNPFAPASTPSSSSSDSSSSSSSSESSSESGPEPGSLVYSSDHSPPPVTAPPPYVSPSPPAPSPPAPSPPAPLPLSVEDEAHAAQVRANRAQYARKFDERFERADSPEPTPALEFEELGGPEFLYAPHSPFVGDEPGLPAASPAPERESSSSPPPVPTAASTASRSPSVERGPDSGSDSESDSESDSKSDSSSDSSRPRKRCRLYRHPRSSSTDSVISRAVSALADELFPPDEALPTPPPSLIKVAPAPATKRQTRNSRRAAGLIPAITVLPPSSAAPDSDGPEPAKRGPGRPKGSLNKRTLAKGNSATPAPSSARAKRRPTPRHIEPPAGTEMAGPLPITGDAPTKLGPFVSAQTVPPIDVDGLEGRPFLDGCDFCLVRDVRCDEVRPGYSCSACLNRHFKCSNTYSVFQRTKLWNRLAERFRLLGNTRINELIQEVTHHGDQAAAQLELARASYQQFERSQRTLGEAMAQLRYGYGNEHGVAYAAEIAPVQRDEFAEFWVAGELSLPPRPPPASVPDRLSRRSWAREPSSYFVELDERNAPATSTASQPAGDSGQGTSLPRRERFFSLTPSNDSEPEGEGSVER